jgi:alkylation response protein AidB-like acyl-CoA dehydrogenase
MNRDGLLKRMRSLLGEPLPLPGSGETPRRHRMLMDIGREDLSLARLAEAHFDAVATLAEAGRQPLAGAIYAVWAAEIPGQGMTSEHMGEKIVLRGEKMFCSGAGLVDRALITVPLPDHRLVDVDLRAAASRLRVDDSAWKTSAFAEMQTPKIIFDGAVCAAADIVGTANWYLERPGFWHGACGPAACWAGGAQGIIDYATQQKRADPHTVAHLGAMHASMWAMNSALKFAGEEIDENPSDVLLARLRARTVRHLVESLSTDILRRLARAYGPHPLAIDEGISKRYLELDLYLRQSHAERDLEALGRDVQASCEAASKAL